MRSSTSSETAWTGWRSGAAGRTGSSRWPCCPWSWQGPCSPSTASCVVGLGPSARRPRWGPLLVVSALGVLSHPLLDFFFNTYGVRFLAPFSWKWFYGDALFIVEAQVWIVLAVGVFAFDPPGAAAFSQSGAARAGRASSDGRICRVDDAVRGRRKSGRRPVRRGLGAAHGAAGELNPFRRQLLLDFGDAYRYGSVEFLPRPAMKVARAAVRKGADDPFARAAAATERGRKFLSWSRFPIFRVEREADGGARVEFADARYPPFHGSWASTVIRLPAQRAGDGAAGARSSASAQGRGSGARMTDRAGVDGAGPGARLCPSIGSHAPKVFRASFLLRQDRSDASEDCTRRSARRTNSFLSRPAVLRAGFFLGSVRRTVLSGLRYRPFLRAPARVDFLLAADLRP